MYDSKNFESIFRIPNEILFVNNGREILDPFFEDQNGIIFCNIK